MKTRNKRISVLLAVLMLLQTMVLGASAMTAEASGGSGEAGVFETVYVNPLYADVITEDDLLRAEDITSSRADVLYADAAEAAETVYPKTAEEASVVMRDGMKARMETIEVPIWLPEWTQECFDEAVFAIYEYAVAHTGVPTEGDYLQWQYGGWEAGGSASYADDSGYNAIITYTVTYYTTAAQEDAVTAKLAEVFADLDVDDADEYTKACAIYDYICANVTYDYDTLEDDTYKLKYTAYAALMDGTAVCQGYALLLYRMALELGVDARLIAGIGNGGAHGWNILQMEDDLYYNADSTWDAGTAPEYYGFFLTNDANFVDHARYEDYATDAFYASYPMGSENYVYSAPCAHEYDDGTVVTEPTCTAPGEILYTCTLCGATEWTEIPMLDHTFGAWDAADSDNHARTCTGCGMTDTAAHEFDDGIVTREATCVQTGILTYTCAECAYSYTEETETIAHTFGAWASADGENHTRSCTGCGMTETAAHTFDNGNIIKEATCQETGICVYTCTVCAYERGDTLPLTDHAYEDGSCTVCGEQDPSVSVTPDAPAVPEILSCYSKTQSAVKVTWTIVDGADGYELWRATTPDAAEEDWQRAKSIMDGNTDRYTNQGLTVGQTYYYKVRAFVLDDDGERICSEFSEISYMPAAVVWNSLTAPGVPYSNATYRVRLLWQEISGAHGYQIWRQNEDGSWAIVKTLGDKGNALTDNQGATTAYSNTGLTAGETYTYKMRAFMITEDGKKVFGAYSDEYSVAVMPQTPTIAVSSPKAGRAMIEWNAINGAAGYQVWMADAENGTYTIVKSITDGSTSYTKYDLESGKTYYFKLRAYSEVDGKKTFGAYSETEEITVP